MSNTVRIDRDAFKRGVEDVMTLAPLRDAVRTASGIFLNRQERDDAKGTSLQTRDPRRDDGKYTKR